MYQVTICFAGKLEHPSYPSWDGAIRAVDHFARKHRTATISVCNLLHAGNDGDGLSPEERAEVEQTIARARAHQEGVKYVRLPEWRMALLIDGDERGGTALIEWHQGKPPAGAVDIVCGWRRESAGPEHGDATLLVLDEWMGPIPDRLHDQLLRAAVQQLDGWAESFTPRLP